MELNFGGIPLEDVLADKSIAVLLEEDLTRLGDLLGSLEAIGLLIENNEIPDTKIGLEGLVKDVVKTTLWTAPRTASKTGKKVYKAVNRGYSDFKSKWKKVIRPLIIKVIKDIGATLERIYFKLSKLDKQYDELGKRIEYVMSHQLKQVGKVPISH